MPDEITKNCLSYWYPKLLAAGLPVPRTEIVRPSREVQDNMVRMVCGEEVSEECLWPFQGELEAAVKRIGLPVFLRTGQGSGKHEWDDCCNLRNANLLVSHIFNLVQWSECVDMIGLPVDVWAVREFLPTMPLMIAGRYGNMPVCREFRFFVNDGVVQCWHPYWPEDSLRDGMSHFPASFDELYRKLCHMNKSEDGILGRLASQAGLAVGGKWSVDILETERGWFVTDMALAHRSFHWPDCPAAVSGQQPITTE
jgi:hypothetical protein